MFSIYYKYIFHLDYNAVEIKIFKNSLKCMQVYGVKLNTAIT